MTYTLSPVPVGSLMYSFTHISPGVLGEISGILSETRAYYFAGKYLDNRRVVSLTQEEIDLAYAAQALTDEQFRDQYLPRGFSRDSIQTNYPAGSDSTPSRSVA